MRTAVSRGASTIKFLEKEESKDEEEKIALLLASRMKREMGKQVFQF